MVTRCRHSVTIVAILAIALSHGASSARTINVPADYGSIQAAVDVAVDGDVVRVQPGVYHESVKVRYKNIDILGNDASNTVIDGDSAVPSVVEFVGRPDYSQEVWTLPQLRGFTITGGGWVSMPRTPTSSTTSSGVTKVPVFLAKVTAVFTGIGSSTIEPPICL